MKKAGNIFLRLIAILGLLVLCFIVVFSFMVFHDTKFLGAIFLVAGLVGILEMSGIVKWRLYRENRSSLVIGTIGAIIVGIYFLL